MPKYLDAENKLRAAVEDELAPGRGGIRERLKAAWYRAGSLGVAGVDVPPSIRGEVDNLRASWSTESGPDTIGKVVAKMTEDECVEEAKRLVRWLHEVRTRT